MSDEDLFLLGPEHDGITVARWVRTRLPDHSWSQVRRVIETRRVRIGGELCVDPARRLHAGERVELLARSARKPVTPEAVAIRYLDDAIVVVEKPSGIATVRHPAERAWPSRRKALHPALEEIVPGLIAQREGRKRKGPLPRLRVVHRLDKGTSGLLVFARTPVAECELGRQFFRHTVMRRYLALIPGTLAPQRIVTQLVRDRGDGRRGSSPIRGAGKEAITHIDVVERLPCYTLLACRLETGRTHQIRIHLAELGHPVCGETVYNRRLNGPSVPDSSGAPRLALHAAELGFQHPVSGQSLHWTMPLPADLEALLARLRTQGDSSKQG
jgi:23S rRNA pseudouridine1911/1915/1917 synthase